MIAILTLLGAAAPILQDPLDGQLPKRDLGVVEFIRNHPEYDGRGIRVAVLDTGIDPGHPFLQATPQGERKIVDWYDATTDGWIPLRDAGEANHGNLLGLSGRRLMLGKWAAPGRTFSLGRIDSDWLPGGLASRIRRERQETWEDGRRNYKESRRRVESRGGEVADTPLAKETKRGFEKFRDAGPVHDVVVFKVDGAWRLLIDNDEDGDLDEETALGSFRETGEWTTLGDEALLHYGAEVAVDGSGATLFFDANGHGTHVAGIIGAWEGPDGRMNGVAPGVEFVAIKIGDGKFGGATSGFSIAKALDYAVASGCHVANISFGGPSFFADGKEPDAWVVDEATRRGLVVVTSAGNEGPVLTTVGAPGTSSAAFTIAAAVWPDTQRVNYGSLDPVEATLFDFSSRGPLPGGGMGIDFTAPGAALSSLPSWLVTLGENFNGTSMAAPQASGCVALLRCAAVAENLAHGPAAVYAAMAAGARPLPGHAWVEQGWGAIHMESSLTALQAQAGRPAGPAFTLEASNPYGKGAGIYVRDLASDRPFEAKVRVAPVFSKDASHAEKASVLRTFRLESEADWVEAPTAVYASANGRDFQVRVVPKGLGPGLHSTRVLFRDADAPAGAPVDLVLPVTLVIPEFTSSESGHVHRASFSIAPGELHRTFLRVPYGARTATVTVRQQVGGRNEFRSGAGSVSGFRFAGDRQSRGRNFLTAGGSFETTVPVEEGTVLEYTLASRWATNTPAELDLTVAFHGLVPQKDEVLVPAGQGVAYLAVKSPLGPESVSVKARIRGTVIPVIEEMEIFSDPQMETIFGRRGLFRGRIEQEFRVPRDGIAVSLFLTDSIQTTEIREDLMVEVFAPNGKLKTRTIASEIETDLGSFDAGLWTLRLDYPSLGQEALEAGFAGAEIRLADVAKSLKLASDLEPAFRGDGGGASLSLQFMGTRSLAARIPQLPALPAGSWYWGDVIFSRKGEPLLELPLRVERPGRQEGAGAVEASGRSEASKEAKTWKEALEAEDPSPMAVLKAARAWASASPRDKDAHLAVLSALVDAGLGSQAGKEGTSFLSRFPLAADEFLALAESWTSTP